MQNKISVIQLARKIRTDVLNLYVKMSSLGAPDYSLHANNNVLIYSFLL